MCNHLLFLKGILFQFQRFPSVPRFFRHLSVAFLPSSVRFLTASSPPLSHVFTTSSPLFSRIFITLSPPLNHFLTASSPLQSCLFASLAPVNAQSTIVEATNLVFLKSRPFLHFVLFFSIHYALYNIQQYSYFFSLSVGLLVNWLVASVADPLKYC